MNAKQILQEASEIVSMRDPEYGGEINLHTIAAFWNVYIAVLLSRQSSNDISLTSFDVATMMELSKIARRATGDHNVDNYIDACGYAAIAGAAAEQRDET